MHERPKIEKPKIKKNYSLVRGFRWDHIEEPKTQENLKLGNLQ
jgi:hypothetical protein